MRQKYLEINQSCSNRSRVRIISYFNNNDKILPGGVEDRGDLIEASGEDILSEADGWRTPGGSVEADGWRMEEWLLACSALAMDAQLMGLYDDYE